MNYCPFSSDSWVAGAIVGGVFGFIVLITIIYICCQAGNCCCKSPKPYHRHRAINPICKYIRQSAINVCIYCVLISSPLMKKRTNCCLLVGLIVALHDKYLKIPSIDTLVYLMRSRSPLRSRSQITGIILSLIWLAD